MAPTSLQKLMKVQLPLAKQTIMAGVNQTIMLALSMVVIASMIGARGLGRDVYQAVTQNNMGAGFEAGLCIVVLSHSSGSDHPVDEPANSKKLNFKNTKGKDGKDEWSDKSEI